MVCNRIELMNLYFLDPLVAGCYQDEDPQYQNSQFNNFSRIDGFDSDLWNNDERFSEEEVNKMLAVQMNSLDIAVPLKQSRDMSESSTAVAVGLDEKTDLAPKKVPTHISVVRQPFICLEEHNLDIHGLHEKEWLLELFGKPQILEIHRVRTGVSFGEGAVPIVVIQRPWIEQYKALLTDFNNRSISFTILHLSDEYGNDDISYYALPACKNVVRMYDRPDLICREKCIMIPLGYHWTLRDGGSRGMEFTPRLPFRGTVWSFYGTNWKGRQEKLAPLMEIGPNRCKFFATWNDAAMVSREEYISTLLDTVFVPCPGGQNPETYRLYEALECGCIPIIVKEAGSETYQQLLTNNLQLLAVSSWGEAVILMRQLYQDKNMLEAYRNTVLTRWQAWKQRLVGEIKGRLQL
jgi:hypothetical protein